MKGYLIDRLHCGEEEHVSDGCGIGEEHTHSVDTESYTACGRHTDLECVHEVFVCSVRFLIALREELFLSFEALSLVDGVVKLGVRVRHLPAVHEELEALDVVRVIGLFLCERRYLNRVIHDKCGLNEVFLNEFLEEEI